VFQSIIDAGLDQNDALRNAIGLVEDAKDIIAANEALITIVAAYRTG
jgi:hypothetical protein